MSQVNMSVARDQFAIDSHKLMYHPEAVGQWLQAGSDWEKLKHVAPVYVEVSPIGKCNHRCSFCAIDYTGYKGPALDADIMHHRFLEMGAMGTKSIMFAGEGEPLLHKHMDQMIRSCSVAGIDVSFTTNAVFLNESFVQENLGQISWIKVSLNAGSSETYQKVHKARLQDFDQVVQNISYAVEYKKLHNLVPWEFKWC